VEPVRTYGKWVATAEATKDAEINSKWLQLDKLLNRKIRKNRFFMFAIDLSYDPWGKGKGACCVFGDALTFLQQY
jgi:hypothetical protein